MPRAFEIVYRWADSKAREADVVWARTKGEARELFGEAVGMTVLEVRRA